MSITNKEKRKVNKRSGSFRLDPSSNLYSGDKTSSSFLGGDGDGACSFAESSSEVKSEVSKWILNSTELHDTVVDCFNYNQNAKLSKYEIDEIIKSAIEDGIRDYKKNAKNAVATTFEDEQGIVDELLPEVIRMYKNEYDSAITVEEDVKSDLQQLFDQEEEEIEQKVDQDGDGTADSEEDNSGVGEDDSVMTESKFSDDLGREYGRTKELHQWTDPNGEIHKMFVAYEEETGEPHWFITYDIYDDIDFDTDSEKVAYEIWDGLKADYSEEVDDDFDKEYPDLESKSLTESDDEKLATSEQMIASVKYIQSHSKSLDTKHATVSVEYDSFNDEVTVDIIYDIPYNLVSDVADELRSLPCRFIVGADPNNYKCYNYDDEESNWDTGELLFSTEESLFNNISREKDEIDEIFSNYDSDPDYREPEEPDPDYHWDSRHDFEYESKSYDGYYKLVKLKEGYTLKTSSDKLPMMSSIISLSDEDIIALNESCKIIKKKIILPEDKCYKRVDNFYKNKVGGNK